MLACVELAGATCAFPPTAPNQTDTESGRLTKAKQRIACSIERARGVDNFVILGGNEREAQRRPKDSCRDFRDGTNGADFGMGRARENGF